MTNPAIDDLGDTADVLVALREADREIHQTEVRKLQLTIEWAVRNTVDPDDPTTDRYAGYDSVGIACDRGLPIAGPGAPLVSEFALMEYAATLGMSTDAAKAHVGTTLELRYRLPRLWQRVLDGKVPLWRARRIAEHTLVLPLAGALEVDRALAHVAHSCSWTQLDHLIDEALARHDPDAAEQQRRAAADRRRFDVDTGRATLTGTVEVHGELDLADALDLDAAITKTAAQLGELGSTESLDVRRSLAAGELARHQLALDLTTGEQTTSPGRGRSVVLNLHLAEEALAGVGNVGRCATTRSPVTVEQIRDWCRTAGQIKVVPVKDLTAHHHVEAYEIPDRLVDQVDARDVHCVFPHCQRRAERCDHDHITPHDPDSAGGATCSDNIAPLCRRHHRAKTHGRWRYRRLHATGYEWTTPHGYRIVRDHNGTHEARPPEH